MIPIANEQRLFKWNDYALQNVGRIIPIPFQQNYCNSDQFGRYWQFSGGMCSYRGLLFTMYGGSNLMSVSYDGGLTVTALSNNGTLHASNYVQAFLGERGGNYSNSCNIQVTTNSAATPNNTGVPMCNLMIVHDGKLFMQAGYSNSPYVFEYGNGTSVDETFSTLTNAPILLNIRKSQTTCQMYLNGNLVKSQSVNFTYNNQYAREMWIGGAAGILASGQSDSGSDHFQGSIHSVVQYSSNLKTSDRQKVEGILAWTYGIQNVLPASHPYVNSRP
jgi:hypothetical protein